MIGRPHRQLKDFIERRAIRPRRDHIARFAGTTGSEIGGD